MIKITYLPVRADCAEDRGLLLDDYLLSFVLNHRYSNCPSDKLLNCLSVSVPLSQVPGCSLGRDAPLLLVWPLLICARRDPRLLDQTADKVLNSKQTEAHSRV